MDEHTANPEMQLELFRELRRKANKQAERETKERIETNPSPTEQEVLAGAFREMLEPHVRDAVFRMREKGYATASSGFAGEDGEFQQIDGCFSVDAETEQMLRNYGVAVLRDQGFGKRYTFLQFRTGSPDMAELKRQWDHLADLLPEHGSSADPNVSGAAEEFLKRFAPTRTDVYERIHVLREQFDKEATAS